MEDTELRVERVLGGITNRIFCVSVKNDTQNQYYSKVLVRVFGAEGIIDREKENEIFEQLAANTIAPSFIGEFTNGRIESWLQGRCISIDGNVLLVIVALETHVFSRDEISDYLQGSRPEASGSSSFPAEE